MMRRAASSLRPFTPPCGLIFKALAHNLCCIHEQTTPELAQSIHKRWVVEGIVPNNKRRQICSWHQSRASISSNCMSAKNRNQRLASNYAWGYHIRPSALEAVWRTRHPCRFQPFCTQKHLTYRFSFLSSAQKINFRNLP